MENNNLFQIFITKTGQIPEKISKLIEKNKSHQGQHEYRFYDDQLIIEFIKNNYDTTVLKAYQSLIPFAYKADLARYLLVYSYGGWYLDIASELRSTLPNVSCSHIVFKDSQTLGIFPPSALSNGFFYSKKSNAFLERAIVTVIDNIRKKYYGFSPLDPTGPNLFGKAFSDIAQSQDGLIGWLLPLTPMFQFKNFAYILPDGEIMAFGKKSTGTPQGLGLSSLGVNDDGNFYSQHWMDKNIYSEEIT